MRSDANNGKYNKRLSIVIFIILTIAIVLIVGYAYAKYVTSKSGEAQAKIAEWNVTINIDDNTDEDVEVDLADTRNKEKEEADVQDGYVAPGTAGMFNIEVNAENSEVSLEYEITMNADYGNNEKFPKNLIFYSDENMENAFYHTGDTIELNGFIGYNDSNKKRTIPIYWKWAYQTGVTDDEKEENDELDSKWLGKTVEPIALKVIAKQVNTNQEENPMANQYAVTLDANGGTLQGYGNTSQTTKYVEFGEKYGDLPTPIRDGYTFVGWSGKNLIDKCVQISFNQYSKLVNGKYIIDASQVDGNKGTEIRIQRRQDNSLKEIIYYSKSVGNHQCCFTKDDTFNSIWIKVNTNTMDPYFVLNLNECENGKEYTVSFDLEELRDAYAVLSNLQLEKGTTASKYEQPQLIQSSTVVNSANNHTLTAIWEKNQSKN